MSSCFNRAKAHLLATKSIMLKLILNALLLICFLEFSFRRTKIELLSIARMFFFSSSLLNLMKTWLLIIVNFYFFGIIPILNFTKGLWLKSDAMLDHRLIVAILWCEQFTPLFQNSDITIIQISQYYTIIYNTKIQI